MRHRKYAKASSSFLSATPSSTSSSTSSSSSYFSSITAWFKLPLRTRTRLRYSLRTAYTTACCLILLLVAPWGGPFTFVSPTLSAVSGVNIFLGMVMKATHSVIWSSVISSFLGVFCGLFFEWPPLLVVIMFICLIWMNQTACFDQLGKVIGSLCIVLGAVLPFVTKSSEAVTGASGLATLISIMIVPFLITAATLLIPYPSLAVSDCRVKAASICDHLESAAHLVVAGFALPGDVDFFGSKVEHLLAFTSKSLSELDALTGHVEWEVILFPQYVGLLGALKVFVILSRRSVLELTGLKSMLGKVSDNVTQQAFAQQMKDSMSDSARELGEALDIIRAYLTASESEEPIITSGMQLRLDSLLLLLPSKSTTSILLNHASPQPASSAAEDAKDGEGAPALISMQIDDDDDDDDDDDKMPDAEALELGRRESMRRRSLQSVDGGSSKTEALHDHDRPLPLLARFTRVRSQLDTSRQEVLDSYGVARARYIWGEGKRGKMRARQQESEHQATLSAPVAASSSEQIGSLALPLADAETATSPSPSPGRRMQDDVEAEIERLSLRNLGPRAAFIHRWCSLLMHVRSYQRVLNGGDDSTEAGAAAGNSSRRTIIVLPPPPTPWSVQAYVSRLLALSALYVRQSFEDACWTSRLLARLASSSTSSSTSTPPSSSSDQQNPSAQLVSALKRYVQPIKIALAISLTSLLVVAPSDPNAIDRTDLWACAVVALIRQDSVASSFLVGYQRLEGTVIGSIFSFIIFTNLGSSVYVTIPALVIWLALCAFFRDGARHGYAAVVAGFTPMVLLLGTSPASLLSAYSRIEKTFIGIGIYLIVDNLIMPVKVATGIREGVLTSIADSREFYCASVKGIAILTRQVDRKRDRSQSTASLPPASQHASESDEETDELEVREAAEAEARAGEAKRRLQKALVGMEALLNLAPHEPEIFFSRAFPQQQYLALLQELQNFSRAGDSLTLAIAGLSSALSELRVNMGDPYIDRHLLTFSYMAKRICDLESSVDSALSKVHEGLSALFQTSIVSTGFSNICALSRVIDSLLQHLDEHYRSFFMQDLRNASLDVHFIVSWQDVFESLCETVRVLSRVGEAILSVRDVEDSELY